MEPTAASAANNGISEAGQGGAAILIEVISRVLATTYLRASGDKDLPTERCPNWANKMSGHWICALREAFQRYYGADNDQSPVVVFGGKTEGGEREAEMAEFGIKGWKRREFMYDLAVVRKSYVDAAFRTIAGDPNQPKQVPVIKRAIWLVESEMAKNGTAVAEDVSKLHIGRSEYSLLIAARVATDDTGRWLSSIGRTMAGIGGEAFIALIPTYASKDKSSGEWTTEKVEIDLYRCVDAAHPCHLATVTARAS
jgi:hypothetical protein